MISFVISLVALVLGYLVYGKVVDRIFGPDATAKTPAVAKADGVDYIVMPRWRVFMIQFLNIAGTGPIFGAIMGAWYGPAAYLWIVLGCIFAGAVHDYFAGMLSIRHGGVDMPEIVGTYLGKRVRSVMLVFSVLLLVILGVVFVYSPAIILDGITGGKMWWILGIFGYYVVATMLPVDKVIGRVYPLFAISLLFMALALMCVLFVKMPELPELWSDLSASNLNDPQSLLGYDAFVSRSPLFPCLFITIACGAISGFHATQSPIMARCIDNEKMGRPIFYGAMITEGVVALIWATASMYFFYYGGWREVCNPAVVDDFLAQAGQPDGKSLIQYFSAPAVVSQLCSGWLGLLGGVLAMLGVVAAPITSGDTAFRSARMIVSQFLHLEQRTKKNRLKICLPMFAVAILILVWQMENPDGFNVIWQYFGWANQTLTIFTLWTFTVYLVRNHKNYFITLIPALFMTVVCSTFLVVSPQAMGLGSAIGNVVALVVLAVEAVWFVLWLRRERAAVRK